MSDDNDSSISLPEAWSTVHSVLLRVSDDDRLKLVQTIHVWFPSAVANTPHVIAPMPAAPTLATPPAVHATASTALAPVTASSTGTVGPTRFPGLQKRAQGWLRRFGIADEILERVFDMEGDGDVIASVTGATKREAAVNCYLLVGAQALMRTDEPRFTEADAVALCKREGVYDLNNHAHTRGTFGNKIAGSKESGYSLPAPGLEAAANLIKMLGS